MKALTILRNTAIGTALALACTTGAKAEVLLAATDTFTYSGTPTLSTKDYSFTVTAANPSVTATLTDNGDAPFFFLRLLVTQLGGATMGTVTQTFNVGQTVSSFAFTAAPGSYKATVSGVPGEIFALGTGSSRLSFGSGTYGVQVAAVPEPEVWAMMLVGAGLVGYQLRRKAKAASAAAIG